MADLLLTCQQLLNHAQSDNSFATLCNLEAHLKLLKQERARNRWIDKGVILGAASFIGNAVIPGIGLLAGPIAVNKLGKKTDEALAEKYDSTIKQMEARIKRFGSTL